MDSTQHHSSNTIASFSSKVGKRILQLALLGLIHAYRMILGPLMGGACRFEPSCSVYAEEAIRMHGPMRGSWLALKRIARCHPWGAFGADPVPHSHNNLPNTAK